MWKMLFLLSVVLLSACGTTQKVGPPAQVVDIGDTASVVSLSPSYLGENKHEKS